MCHEYDRILYKWLSGSLQSIKRVIYLIVDFSVQLDSEVPTMLRHAVLVVCLEEPSNDICVVPVRPYSSLGNVGHEVLFWPEDICGYRRARLPLIIPLFLALLQPKERLDARVGVLAMTNGGRGSQMRPCCSWMPSEAMDEDDAASSQNTLWLRGEVVLQIMLVPTSAVACGEQSGPYPVDLCHDRRRKKIRALCESNISALRVVN